jgi:hypothetical protein
MVVRGLKKGALLASAPAPPVSKTWRRDSATKMASTRIWKIIRSRLAAAAVLIPMMLRAEVITMKPTIHSQVGTPGNLAERKAAPISQMTMGRKK